MSKHETRQRKWDLRFLALASHISGWSKDPSTKTGAIIVDPELRIVSTGYNGFARGTDDSPEQYANRELKYKRVVHCERNAIIFARQDLRGCTLYTVPFMPCAVCAGMVIQAGIKRVVAPIAVGERAARWAEEFKIALADFESANVEVTLYEPTELAAAHGY